MKQYFLIFGFLLSFTGFSVQAAEFSTSVMKPTPLVPEGIIGAVFPQGGGKTVYYFSVEVQKGELLTQISFKGSVGREKRVELALLNGTASLMTAYWIQGAEAQRDAVRSFPIKEPSRQLLRVTVSGPETDEFRLEFGGSALPQPSSPSAAASSASTTPQPSQ
jgi:hypothetical protein